MHIPHTHRAAIHACHSIPRRRNDCVGAGASAEDHAAASLSLSVVFAAMKATSSRRSRETFHCSRLAFRLVLAIKSLP
jgi:hypothetical protein